MTSHPPVFSRRTALGAAAVGLAAVTGAAAGAPASAVQPPIAQPASKPKRKSALTFRPDGSFTVVQFNDAQDNDETDSRTVALMEAVLDTEKPDFALINGDVINGDMTSAAEVKLAIHKVVTPMEERKIPWAITFGNHDEDAAATSGMTEEAQLDYYQSYAFNRNAGSIAGVTGTSNTQLLVNRNDGGGVALALWLIDTGRYAPEEIAGQNFDSYPGWDWVRMSTVQWYVDASIALERKYGRKIPGAMWGHIALHEHRNMWFDSIDSRTDADHARAVVKHAIVGERNEDECPGPFNSGLFSAFLDRGDIRSFFVGHDHINTYSGNYFGIELGYAPGTGYAPYGLDGDAKNTLRGARVFRYEQDADGVYVGSRNVFARDLGIDVSATPAPTPGTDEGGY